MNNVQTVGNIGTFLTTPVIRDRRVIQSEATFHDTRKPERVMRVLPVIQRLLIGYLLFMLFPHVFGVIQTVMGFAI